MHPLGFNNKAITGASARLPSLPHHHPCTLSIATFGLLFCSCRSLWRKTAVYLLLWRVVWHTQQYTVAVSYTWLTAPITAFYYRWWPMPPQYYNNYLGLNCNDFCSLFKMWISGGWFRVYKGRYASSTDNKSQWQKIYHVVVTKVVIHVSMHPCAHSLTYKTFTSPP